MITHRCAVAVFSLLPIYTIAAEPTNNIATFEKRVQPLLNRYCMDCHGPKEANGNLRFDQLNPQMVDSDSADHWHEVLNRLNVGEMPPEEAPQPTDVELETLTSWLTSSLEAAAIAKRSQTSSGVIRRLTRNEYNNTLNDLFGVDLNVSSLLPPEGPSEDGFTSNGETLVISPLHFEYYLKIAKLYLRKAIVVDDAPAKFGTRFEFRREEKGKFDLLSSSLEGDAEAMRASLNLRVGKGTTHNQTGDDWIVLEPATRAVGTGIPARQGPKPLIQIQMRAFPTEGKVRIRVKAAALESKDGRYPYLGVAVGNHLDDGIEIKPVGDIQQVTASPDAPQVYEFVGRLENLPLPFRKKDTSKRGDLNQAMIGIWNAYERESGGGPRLAIYSVDFEAPVFETWPPQPHTRIFKKSPNRQEEEIYAREIFTDFLGRAYRRPASDPEIDRILSVWRAIRVRPVAPTIKEKPVEIQTGIQVRYFEPHSADVRLATLSARSPTATGIADKIEFDVPQRKRDDEFALHFRGKFKAPKTGLYRFHLTSDDGSRLYVNGEELIDNDGLHGFVENNASLRLSQGWHGIDLTYFDNGGGDGLKLEWSGPGFDRQSINNAELSAITGERVTVEQPQTFEESIRDALPLALVSPAFLYLVEPAQTGGRRRLNDYELASRLSYFLWKTMPDEELLRLAGEGKLTQTKVLRQQVQRMIADSQSNEFISTFVHQWLDLESLDRVAVNRDRFRSFMPFIKQAMRAETVAYFAEILHSDENALALIDSDFAVINPLLAKHYGVEGVFGAEFRRVQLGKDVRRGGLLSHGSMLTGNSNGLDSHPVKRGVWVLKKLLNDPPPPPPPNVPDLDFEDPKLSGLPLKEQLIAHREHVACNSCHRKIDPWGIPFEEFSAIGQKREFTKTGKVRIVAETELPDGSKVNGVAELGRYLVNNRSNAFGKAITFKLTTHALGRSLSFADNDEINTLFVSFRDSDYRLRVLIEEIVLSNLFRMR